jgi:hypothetical protein
MSRGTCSLCHRDIIWALTVMLPGGGGRKRMPLDPAQVGDDDEYANVAVHRDHLGSVFARVLSADDPTLRPGERRAVPHFATCPKRTAKKAVAPTPARRAITQSPGDATVLTFRPRSR